MAHHRRGAKSAGLAGHTHIRFRQHRACRNPNLPRRQIGHRGSRQPRPPDQSHPRHRLRLRRGARRHNPGAGNSANRSCRPKTAALHQLRRPVDTHLGEVGERRLRHRQHRLARGGKHHRRNRAPRAAVQFGQRRLVLRQSGRRPGAHLVGLVREQHPLGALPAVDAGGGQPRERIRQRANRLRRLPDLFRVARVRVQPGNPRPVVLVHCRLGAGGQPQQRRRRLPGRRQLLRARLLGRGAKALANKRTR